MRRGRKHVDQLLDGGAVAIQGRGSGLGFLDGKMVRAMDKARDGLACKDMPVRDWRRKAGRSEIESCC